MSICRFGACRFGGVVKCLFGGESVLCLQPFHPTGEEYVTDGVSSSFEGDVVVEQAFFAK